MNRTNSAEQLSRQSTDDSPWLRLLRLVVLPPAERRAWPFGIEKKLSRLLTVIGQSIGVEQTDNVGAWLKRIFLLTTEETRQLGSYRLLRRASETITTQQQMLLQQAKKRLRIRDDEGLDEVFAKLPVPGKLAIALLLLITGAVLLMVITTPMSWSQQMWFAGGMFVVALLLRRHTGRAATLILISFSVFASLRYIWWRANNTLDLESNIELVLGIGLFMAEIYALLILLLGFIQTSWPLKRKPAELPADRSLWPVVDVYIPTYNEPLSIVKPTVFAAQNLDWPADKLNIYLLDDGRRDSFREFAEEAGVEYIIRPDNDHAKAGNLNHALTLTKGEFIAIFDCDHMPVRSFLQVNMGWFLADPKCALVQTPHHFFSPDPLERNLGTFKRVPNEGKLFYGLIQDGNDLWNATFFCGSCAVIRRKPLEEVGGIAVETVTEDAHTALKMHRRGYNSVYMNVVQAAGLATESLAGHIGQRIRWARGMAQIFATDNPLRGKGLSFFQRLCYSNSMLHFFHGIPRLVFLTAPLAYMFFGFHVFNAEAIMIAAFVLPHLCQAMIANSQMQSRFRHSYWAEVYESLLAWYIALPTTLALLNPKLGSFNVTDKGGQIESNYFDWQISRPYLVLMVLSLLGFLFGIIRLLWWNAEEAGTVLMNLAWTSYNLIIIGAAVGVAQENKQVRLTHRVDWQTPVTLYLPDGRTVTAESENFSLGGMKLKLNKALDINSGTAIDIGLFHGRHEATFPSRVVNSKDNLLSLQFEDMTTEMERMLIRCTFSRADAWVDWDEKTAIDRPLSSLLEIIEFGIKGYGLMLRRLFTETDLRRIGKRPTTEKPLSVETH